MIRAIIINRAERTFVLGGEGLTSFCFCCSQGVTLIFNLGSGLCWFFPCICKQSWGILGAVWSWPNGEAQICAEVTTFMRFHSFLPAFPGNQRVVKVLGKSPD